MKFTTSTVVAAFCAFGSVVATIGDGDVGAASVVTAYPLGMLNDEFVCEKRWKVKHVKEHAKFASKYIPTADGAAANGAPSGWPKEFNTTDDHILHGCSGVVYQWPLTDPNYTEGTTVGSDFLLVEADYAGDKIELCNAVTTGANGDLVECDHHRSEY